MNCFLVFGQLSWSEGNLELEELDGNNGFIIEGIETGPLAEIPVNGAGDVNGDSFDDVIIGIAGSLSSGATYVIFGGGDGFTNRLDILSLDGTNGFKIEGIDEGDSFGSSVSGAGDVNGDGIDDMIIGAFSADPMARDQAGESYLIYGALSGFDALLELSSLDGSNGFRINGSESLDLIGHSVSGAGDVNGDGYDDVIISSTVSIFKQTPERVYIVFGGIATGGLLNQTIAFDQIANTVFKRGRVQLPAIASSGLPLTFALVSGPGLLNPDGSLSLTGTGVVSIQAWQTGNSQYNPSPDVERSFTVVPATTGGASLLEAGNGKFVNDRTQFDGNVYNGYELAGEFGSFKSIAGEITRISFLDLIGNLVFVEFGSDDPNSVLFITLDQFVGSSVASPYDQPTTVYAKGHARLEIQNSTPLTFVSIFTLGNDQSRIDTALVRSDTFTSGSTGVAEIQSLTINDGSTSIGGINAANVNFVGFEGVIGIDAPNVSVEVFLFVGNLTPSGTAEAVLRISSISMIESLLVTGGDFAETIGRFQIDTNGVAYSFPIQSVNGQRSIRDSRFRLDLGAGNLPAITNTFVEAPDDYFLTDGIIVMGPSM